MNFLQLWFLQPGLTFENVLVHILAVIVIVFLILPLHELAHAWVAYKLGDKTAKAFGRLTFSPLAHFDPIGAICILIFGFGWAKPVPVDMRFFKKPRRDMALVALAGPISNLLAAIVGGLLVLAIVFSAIFMGVANNVTDGSWINCLVVFVNSYIRINIGLAVFNLIPLHPLDGSKVLEALIPGRFLAKFYNNYRRITFIIFLFLFFGFLSGPIDSLINILYYSIMYITKLPFLAFL